jgi:hypothetical protein
MSISRKCAHDDIVKVIETGETGVVTSFHQDENGFVYGVQLGRWRATETAVPEDALEPVKMPQRALSQVSDKCVRRTNGPLREDYCAGWGF